MASTTPPTSIDVKSDKELKVLSILAETYPNLDCGPGTPVYEMVVRPIALLWAQQDIGISELTAALDITNYQNMQEDDLDRLLSRYFITRNKGAYVTGLVRIMFTDRVDVYIGQGDLVEANGDRVYEITNNHHLTGQELSGDSVNGYYVDVAVQSIGRGGEYNASANDAVTVTGGAQQLYSRAYFVEDTTDGGTSESNALLINRAVDQTSNRGLYCYKSVQAAIRDNFNTVLECTPIGLRDDEMLRDLVHIRGGYGICHVGGKCDIYIRPTSFRIDSGYQAPLGFPMSFEGDDGITYDIATDPEGLQAAWNAIGIKTEDATLRGSSQESIPLLSPATKMKTLTSDLSELDTFVNSTGETLLHTDNVVKQKWPLVVYVKVIIEDDFSADAIETSKETIAMYINSLPTNKAPTSTEIIYLLRAAGISTVHLPVSIYAYYLTENLKIQCIGLNKYRNPPSSLLIPQQDDSLLFTIEDRSQISLKTCCWYTNKDLIDIEVTT